MHNVYCIFFLLQLFCILSSSFYSNYVLYLLASAAILCCIFFLLQLFCIVSSSFYSYFVLYLLLSTAILYCIFFLLPLFCVVSSSFCRYFVLYFLSSAAILCCIFLLLPLLCHTFEQVSFSLHTLTFLTNQLSCPSTPTMLQLIERDKVPLGLCTDVIQERSLLLCCRHVEKWTN